MTKVEAIKQVIHDNGGVATWEYIYNNIGKYYTNIEEGSQWKAGIRGVLYRELNAEKSFKKIGLGIFALLDFQEEKEIKEIKKDPVKMHSYMEGIMVELGNYEKHNTYCADLSAKYQENVPIRELTTIENFPEFTYPDLIKIAKYIDVVWFTKSNLPFPKRLIEIVDSIETLENSVNRMYQLKEFQNDFYILTPEKYIQKVFNTINKEPYFAEKNRVSIKTYEEAEQYYRAREELQNVIF